LLSLKTHVAIMITKVCDELQWSAPTQLPKNIYQTPTDSQKF